MAMDNRRENAPYVIGNLEDVIHGLNESLGMEETPEEYGLDSFLDCSVLTSQDGLFGASCILYPEAVKELAAAKGGNFSFCHHPFMNGLLYLMLEYTMV